MNEETPESLNVGAGFGAKTRLSRRNTTIEDRYELRGILGEGGFGVVYDAFDREKKQAVALKAMRSASPSTLLGFKREFRTLIDLRHPNLVELHELSGDNDGLYFTMEKVEGAVHFTEWGLRGHAELRSALAQMFAGLAALHSAGLVHRDIKPSNVLIDHTGRVVLVDFGLTREICGIDDDGTEPAGTPKYMAPEQCDDGAVLTPAVDAYAVGVMLFECLVGRPPFRGNVLALTVAKQRRDAPSVLSLCPTAPRDLAQLTDRLLAREPADRPALASLTVRARATLPPPEATFVGRKEPLARLQELVRMRVSRMVEITGPSGIGKTALMNEFLSNTPGVLVLRGRCHPREDIAYKAFDGLMDQLATMLTRRPELATIMLGEGVNTAAICTLFPVMRPHARRSERTVYGRDEKSRMTSREQAIAAVRQLFVRLGERLPLILAIDDIQWGDADSASLLGALLRQPGAPGLLIVATRRTGETGALVSQLERQAIATQKETWNLEPLSKEESYALARRLLPNETRAEQVATQSAGHPLLLRELALHEGVGTLNELIGRRVHRLSSSTRRLLKYMSIAGYPLSDKVAATLVGSEARDKLRTSDLTTVGPDGMRVSHDRVAEVVEAMLEGAERKRLHLSLAEILIGLGDDSEQIANHLARAGDRRAPAYLLEAAAHASASLGFARAAILYEELIASHARGENVPVQLRSLLHSLGHALAGAGQPRSAAEAYLHAADLAADGHSNQGREQELRCLAAQQLALTGEADRAWQIFNGAFREWGMGLYEHPAAATMQIAANLLSGRVRSRFRPTVTSARHRARLDVLWNAFGSLNTVQPFASVAIASKYIHEARSLDDPLHRFRAAGLASYASAFRAGPAGWSERRARLQEAFAPVSENPRAKVSFLHFSATIDSFGLRTKESVEPALASLTLAGELGNEWGFEGVGARTLLASGYQQLGDMPLRDAFAARVIAEGAARDHPILRGLGHLQGWMNALVRNGESEEALWHQKAADEVGCRTADVQRNWYHSASVVSALSRGEPYAAWLLLQRGLKERITTRLQNVRLVVLTDWLTAGLVSNALAAAGNLGALEHSRRFRDHLRPVPTEHTLSMWMTLEAGITSIEGNDEKTILALHNMCHAAELSGCVLNLAMARRELAELEGNAKLGRLADAFFKRAQIADSIYAARFVLPGRFYVTGMR